MTRGARLVGIVVLALGLAGFADAQPAAARGDIRGRIVNATTSQPVRGALVFVEEAPEATANIEADGTFRVSSLPPGMYHLLVTAPGFIPLRTEVVVGSSSAPLEVALQPELHYHEVVSVSGTPKDQFIAYEPTSVLAGQELAIDLEGSLGAALRNQPGMAERSFGPAPSRPVIRGLDGDRVLILEDGQRTGDLSSQSGDHGVTVNPAVATRLEVVRGPAALLYGANAIGGLVNVISEQVPSRPADRLGGTMQVDVGSAAAEAGGAADVLVGNGRWAFRAGGSARRSGDVSTPEGTVDNTQARSALGAVALSWTGAQGYLGGSYGYDDSRYGVPVIEEGLVELTPRRHAVSIKGEHRDLPGIVTGVRGNLGYRNYRHDEVVAGTPETRFDNDSVEFDVLATQRDRGRLKGTFGGWGLVRAFESTGEEALSPPVDQDGLALFLFEELTWPHATVQFGARYDRAAYDVKSDELPDRTFDNLSASAGLVIRPSEETTIAVSLARAARSPALEELYYFGPHPGNFAFEIGNADLASEKALGLDVAFRWRLNRVHGEVAYFRNSIRDYIFRQPLSEEEFDERYGEDAVDDDDHEGHEHGDFPIIEYVGADSLLQGFEAHADVELTGSLIAEVTFDYVRGELQDSKEPLPRIPPLRFIGGLRYQRAGIQIGGDLTAVATQDRVFEEETPTAGYTLLKLFGAYSFAAGGVVHTITGRLDNVTNELYRNHLSLIKDYVAEMGRNVKVVYSLQF